MTGPARILATLLGVAAVAVVAVIMTGGDDGYTAKVELPNAYGVRKNSSVKIAGANGGKIKEIKVRRGPDGKDIAVVEMKMKEEAVPIGANASVTVRPTDLLGERYIALDPGDLSKPQPSGTVIPASRTSPPVELDNILNSFDNDVRGKMRILINEFGIALEGRGADFNKLIGELPASLGDAQKLVGQIADENVALRKLVTRGDTLLAKVNTKKDDFGRSIEDAGDALDVVADNRKNLGATIRSAPGALSELVSTLNSVQSASASLGPASDSLRKATAPLTSMMRTLPSFQDAAQDTLKAATSASPAITRLGKGATPGVRALRPTAQDVTSILNNADPTLQTIGRRADKDLLWFLQNVSGWFTRRDGLTHTVQANLNMNPAFLKGALETYIDQDGGKKRSVRTPDPQPAPTGAAPDPQRQAGAPAPAPEQPKLLKLPELKLPKLPLLEDLPATLSELPEKVKELPKQLMQALPKLEQGIKETLDGLTQGLTGQQGKENSDAMGLFDYLFAP